MTVVQMEAAAAIAYFGGLPRRTPEQQAVINLRTRGWHITGPYAGDPATRAAEWRHSKFVDGWDIPAGTPLEELHMPWVTIHTEDRGTEAGR